MVFVHEGQKYDMDEAALVAEPQTYSHVLMRRPLYMERVLRLWYIAGRYICEVGVDEQERVPGYPKWVDRAYVIWRMLPQATVDEIANQTQDARLLAVIPKAEMTHD